MKFAMADGRQFTEWRSNCRLNNEIKNKLNITNDHDYRLYLQRNAEKVKSELFVQLPSFKYCPVCEAAVDVKYPMQ